MNKAKPAVVLVKGMSSYGALGLHIDQIATAFADKGYTIYLLDFGADDWRDTLARAARDEILLIFSISIFTEVRLDGLTLAEILDAPHICLQVDHPGWHIPRIQKSPPQSTIFLTLDHSHKRFIEKKFGQHMFQGVEFLPPAANVLADNAPVDIDQFAESRDIPVLFTGTYRGNPEPLWRGLEGQAGQLFKKIYGLAADMAMANDLLSADAVVNQVIADAGFDDDFPLTQELQDRTFWLSNYIHAKRRHAALVALNAAGVPVHVYGHGFDKEMHAFPNFVFGGVGSFQETLGLIRRTKIILNTNTHFVEGAHERVFAAMAGGAAVASDLSTYYQQIFTDGEDILLYSWQDLDAFAQRVRGILADPTALATIAQAGQAKVMAEHLWAHRVSRLIELAEGCRHPYSQAA